MTKRIILSLLILCMPLLVSARIGHALFLDTPINGTITKFEKALTGKHKFELVDKADKNGLRYYRGKYRDFNIGLTVQYDPASQTVYAVSMFIPTETVEEAFKIKNYLGDVLPEDWYVVLRDSRHGTAPSLEGYMMEEDRQYADRISLFDNDFEVGWMEIYVGKSGEEFMVVVDMYDLVNGQKFSKLPQ